jgi:hypothetical protein
MSRRTKAVAPADWLFHKKEIAFGSFAAAGLSRMSSPTHGSTAEAVEKAPADAFYPGWKPLRDAECDGSPRVDHA